MHSSDLLLFVVYGGTDPLTSMIREVIPRSGMLFDSTLVGVPRVLDPESIASLITDPIVHTIWLKLRCSWMFSQLLPKDAEKEISSILGRKRCFPSKAFLKFFFRGGSWSRVASQTLPPLPGSWAHVQHERLRASAWVFQVMPVMMTKNGVRLV